MISSIFLVTLVLVVAVGGSTSGRSGCSRSSTIKDGDSIEGG